jgi:hypothetical protein
MPPASIQDRIALGAPMGLVRDWLKRRQAKEHERLIRQCRGKATALIGFMEAAHAATQNPDLAGTLEQLQRFEGNLAQRNLDFIREGKLRPNDAEYLTGQLKMLTVAVVGFVQVNRRAKHS